MYNVEFYCHGKLQEGEIRDEERVSSERKKEKSFDATFLKDIKL